MASYAIGDVQGCHDQLLALLDHIKFDPARDRLRFAGDLVNRGPRSTDVLRFVRSLGGSAESVLGNHDLHLLAACHGLRKPSRGDTLREVLDAPDRDELLEWLRTRPVLDEDPATGNVLVHAGVAPGWDLPTARACARELETVLRGDALVDFLGKMYGDEPRQWRDGLKGYERLRFITNAFTRMRYCDRRGRLDFSEKRPPGKQARGLTPWFAVRKRKTRGLRIVFGHWATLQVAQPLDPAHGVIHVDTGCVWGGTLTALREDDGEMFSVPGWRGESAQRRR